MGSSSGVRDKFVTAGGAWPNNLMNPGAMIVSDGLRPRPT